MPPMTPPAIAPVRARLDTAPTGTAVAGEVGESVLADVEGMVDVGMGLEVEGGAEG